MTYWLNHVTIDATGAGSHTADPSNPTAIGTVVDGSAFTPTAGRLLVCVVGGPVTSGTPTGWTLPSGGSAVSTDGLYVFYKTAAGSDTLITGHNSAAYHVVFDFYEFASGASFGSAASFPAAASGSTKTLSSLTGTNLVMSPICSPGTAGVFSFTGATKHVERLASDNQSRFANSNIYSSASSVGVAATSASHEQLVFAIAGVTNPDATVAAVAATATSSASAPAVSGNFSAAPPAASASASATAPAVTGTGDATIVAVAATATGTALPPGVSADVSVTGTPSTATASAYAPSLTFSANLTPPAATATAAAVAPFVDDGSGSHIISPPPATATAIAPVPAVNIVLTSGTTVANAFSGLDLVGAAEVAVDVPVADPPVPISTVRVDKAVALPNPVLVKGRPT